MTAAHEHPVVQVTAALRESLKRHLGVTDQQIIGSHGRLEIHPRRTIGKQTLEVVMRESFQACSYDMKFYDNEKAMTNLAGTFGQGEASGEGWFVVSNYTKTISGVLHISVEFFSHYDE